jgi:hypothetical protein
MSDDTKPAGTIARALLAARKKMRAPSKTAQNPHFGNKYAPLDELVDVSFDSLAAEGLMIVQAPQVALDGRMVLRTVIHHESGERLDCGDYDLGQLTTAQAMGSAITYARRYSLGAILGLAAEDDDDGEAATNAPRPRAKTAPKAAPTAPSQKVQGVSSDRMDLEQRFYSAWQGTRTAAQNASVDDWKNRGSAVKTILDLTRFIKVSEMTDEQLWLCIGEWTGGAERMPDEAGEMPPEEFIA